MKKSKRRSDPDTKCIVSGCPNLKNQGEFVGDLCGPCHAFVARGVGEYSQAYRNALHLVGVKIAHQTYLNALRMVQGLDPTQSHGQSISDQALRELVRKGES